MAMHSSSTASTLTKSRQKEKYVTAVKFCLFGFNCILVVSLCCFQIRQPDPFFTLGYGAIFWAHPILFYQLVALLVVMYQLTPLITAPERTKILGAIVAYVEPICLSILCIMVFISAVFGYCAIAKPSICGMTFYIVMLCSLAIIVSVILGMKVSDRTILEKSVADSLFDAIEKSARDKEVLQELNKIQNTYVCCGVHSYMDWMKGKNIKLPSSCCDDFHDNCDQNSKSFRKESCIRLIMDHQYYRFSTSDKLAYALALFGLLFGILLSAVYVHMIRIGPKSQSLLPKSHAKRSIFSDRSTGRDESL